MQKAMEQTEDRTLAKLFKSSWGKNKYKRQREDTGMTERGQREDKRYS